MSMEAASGCESCGAAFGLEHLRESHAQHVDVAVSGEIDAPRPKIAMDKCHLVGGSKAAKLCRAIGRASSINGTGGDLPPQSLGQAIYPMTR
jgi:hypothetical protein